MTPGDTAALQRMLAALWRLAPPLRADARADAPTLRSGEIVLPAAGAAAGGWDWCRAAATHAAAHLVFSPPVFDGRGARPIVRVLVGLLEDARVEALAGRELPGLRRLWAALHAATPADGDAVPALLGRLSRALADPGYRDPHPWIAKGRALFFADTDGEVLAAGEPARLRHVASRLGHDLGQMRLGLDTRAWRPVPSYRDDNAWMWPAEALERAAAEPSASGREAGGAGEGSARPRSAPVARLPEWDRLIGRLRPDWVDVVDDDPPLAAQPLAPLEASLQAAARRAAGAPGACRERGPLATAGERLDIDAALDTRVARRLRQAVDPRVYRTPARVPTRRRTLLLLDRSLSSADPAGDAGGRVLDLTARAAWLLACALQARRTATGVYAFSSAGRHALRMACLKHEAQPLDDGVLGRRLAGLQPGGSSRIGAALRRALQLVGPARADRPATVVMIGDGEAHDVDIHDPRYLEADLQRALREARRGGVRVCSLLVGPAGRRAAGASWRGADWAPLRRPADVPALIRRLAL